jgi:predicted HTH transcriptional regulator
LITFFEKAVREIDAADIRQLIEERYPETEVLEFKRELPDREGKPSKWPETKSVSDHARNQVLAEIVGMANTRGGYVILGIEESNERPKR